MNQNVMQTQNNVMINNISNQQAQQMAAPQQISQPQNQFMNNQQVRKFVLKLTKLYN